MAVAVGCRVPPFAPGAPPAAPGAFSATGPVAAPARWWTALGDARLDALMARALAGNLDLLTAWDRLAQAEALARRAGADLEPSLTADGSASRTRTKTKRGGTASASEVSLGLAASYEVDLWGRIRASRDAAALAAGASREDVDATALLLTAQVATTWYRLLDQLAQLELLDEQLATNEKYLEVLTGRLGREQKRTVTFVDVLQQRQLVEATRAEKHRAEGERRVLEHQLAALLGQTPDQRADAAGAPLPALPALPATGLPSALLARRPDVRAAQLRLAAASHDVAAAVADRLPRLGLTARGEAWGDQARNLFDNWLASIAANLTAPILDGSRRAAEVDRTRAAALERLHAYGQAVLDALREVEDALARERQQQALLDSLEQQLKLATDASDQAQENYAKGAEDYLRVLTALQSLQRLQRDRLTATRQLIEFRIDLYRALGGGWDLARPGPPAARGAHADRSEP
jgi:NodT family efflux transporter outer membrane factor (OMF) lipoprotein